MVRRDEAKMQFSNALARAEFGEDLGVVFVVLFVEGLVGVIFE